MYNIIQLNDKELSELQTIAKELGIKKAESMKKDELVYTLSPSFFTLIRERLARG